MYQINSRFKSVLFSIVLICGCALMSSVSADPRIDIQPLDIKLPTGTLTIPWVTVGDTHWHDGQPLFNVTDAEAPARWARGWMAVTSDNILIHVVVHHTAHLSCWGSSALWSGDAIQFGIDPLGRGAAQPALIDIPAELAKLAKKSPADIEKARKNFEKRNTTITDGNLIDMQPEDQDFCVGTLMPNTTPAIYSYYAGHGSAGDVTNASVAVTRDEATQLTTYEVAIPWSQFGLLPGLSPIMKVAFQINNSNGNLGVQKRLYWGSGMGGCFAPWKFHLLAIGDPPVGTTLCSLTPVKKYVSGVDDYAEILAATCGASATITAKLGGVTRTLNIPRPPTMQHFSLRAYPGALRGSINLTADLHKTDIPHSVTTVALRVFDDSSTNWYTFAPKSDTSPSVIGMADWLDAPAGKHGFIQAKGKDQVFEDGTPVKLWGVGTASYASGLAPDKQTAEAMAAWYQKWGVNSVRNGLLFGTGWMGIGDANDTTKLDPAQLDRFDYSFTALKNKGVYYNIVSFWTEGLRPADKDKVLAYDEVKAHASELDSFAEDIQNLRIAAVVNFLKHKNPYTGLSYAEDAALSCIEIRNEQDIYWYPVAGAVAACPTYQAKIRKQFCDWLRARYGTQEKLVASWGTRCIGCMMGCEKDESLDKNTLHPAFNAWFFSTAGFADQQTHFGAGRRLLDCAEFLYECQTQYYTRFADAIRAAGYKGLLVGSNWQAGDGISHLYNLLSDRQAGRIDRHNYFGGANAYGMNVGIMEDNSSMLWQPGSALLSSGMQQIGDRPFALSEWMEQAPDEWEAEGTPIIGFYGFGLQGWDTAYAGNNTLPNFDATYGTWLHVQTPLNISLYPAVARAIFRGDVHEGDIIGARRFSQQELRDNKLNFTDTVTQNGDVKTISSTVPGEALAAGRVVLEVVDKPTPSLIPDLSQQLIKRVIVSNTGQLTWHYPSHDESYFTINTDGTKGVVGFAPNTEFPLGKVRLQVDNKFAVLLVTALERGKTLANTKSALITAVARARNTGMEYNAARNLTALGVTPIVLEPIFASVTFTRKIGAVYLLDHDGKRTPQTARIDAGKVIIDGMNDKTLYYEVEFK